MHEHSALEAALRAQLDAAGVDTTTTTGEHVQISWVQPALQVSIDLPSAEGGEQA